jgi:Flp pilus assembly CpaF family ATPase
MSVDVGSDYAESVRRQREQLMAAVEGPIAEGLAQRDVTEVIAYPNGIVCYDHLYGTLERVGDIRRARLEGIIVSIAGLLKKKLNEGVLQGELVLDGSRIQAWMPPVSPTGPGLVIRKHRKQGVDFPALTLDDYDIPPLWRETLETISAERLCLLIVGSTASGKSTFAGAVLNRITTTQPEAAIVTIEDTAELYCSSEYYLPLHSTEDVSQRMLVKTAMRARPDWLILGEVRDEAAIDMIMGLGTGHPGFSTVHGGSIEQGLTRVRQLTRLGGDDTISPEMVSDAIQYALLMRREPAGPRRVAAMAKVLGWRDGRYQLEYLPAQVKDNV